VVSSIASMVRAESRTRSRFFLLMAIVLFLPVLMGFGPTFYLRFWLAPPPRRFPYPGGVFPTYLAVHGTVLTLWCLFLILQSALVNVGRTATHRLLGVFGVGLALAVVAVGLYTMAGFVDRRLALGASPQQLAAGVIVGDTRLLLTFVAFFGAALWWRRTPAAHKRLMLFAGLTVIGPAFAAGRPVGRLFGQLLPDGVPLGLPFWVAFIAALVVHDFVELKRVHWATVVGTFVFGSTVIVGRMLEASSAGSALVEWFGRL
jgi:hypothetical protein